MVPDKINVFLLAENRLLREALARILNKKGDVRVVGATGLSPQVVEQITVAGPDVLLSDSTINSFSGLQIIPELRKAVPGLRVVMIGMGTDKETFLRAVRDGIAGYVLKEASALEVAAAVRAVVNDEAVCPPDLCRTLFDYISSQGAQLPSFQIRHDLGLSRREQQLVQMIGRGLTNKEIASQLNLSEQTVKNHVHRMLRKVGAKDRLAVVELCRMQGLVA
jgi:two-component system, NarL family, response regulator DevR